MACQSFVGGWEMGGGEGITRLFMESCDGTSNGRRRILRLALRANGSCSHQSHCQKGAASLGAWLMCSMTRNWISPPQPVDAASVRKAFLFTVSTEGSLLHTQTLTVVNIQHTSGKEYVGILLFINFFFFFSMLLNLPTSRCRLIFSSHYKSSWIGWKNLFILSSLRSAEIPCLLRWKNSLNYKANFCLKCFAESCFF